MSASALLGPDGPLARALPGYEARPGQLAMADAVERAIGGDRVLVTEAGTGTGKTLAYLVPAILSGKKVVVSTATRALQDQIFRKDLPLIESALGIRPNAALMKGLSNYVCRRRFEEHRRSGAGSAVLPMLEDWVLHTETGDVAELSELAEDDPEVLPITSSSDTRLGASCRYHAECFVTRMKREAESARLLIVNHHLFFADLALRGEHPGRVIPDYDAVIFDEAHQLEDVATLFFGVRISAARVERLVSDVDRAVVALARSGVSSGQGLVVRARAATRAFFGELAAGARALEGRATVDRDFFSGERQSLWHELDDALLALHALAEGHSGGLAAGMPSFGGPRRDALALADSLSIAARRADAVRRDLATAIDGSAGRVTWVDLGSRSPSLSSSPVDVSALIRSKIFESIPAVVLTSATLSNGKNGEEGPSAFSFLRSRLGLDGESIVVDEQVVPSPFDYESRALLYLPKDLPPPADPRFLAEALVRIRELVEITGGGAFVLTTSLRSMRALHEGLRHALPDTLVLVQGAAPKAALLDAFRERGDAVLVATASFWQGVDVPGDALRLVVLEKIPFPVPSEPVVWARSKLLEEEGKNPFVDLHLPIAKIALKQGFGRLIRTRSDRGVVALLDERVHRRGYGKGLVAALPGARRTGDLDEVRAFWASMSPAV